MYFADYHVHSKYSFDSVAELDDICEQAVIMGLSEIALTDHFDVHYHDTIKDTYYLEHEQRREEAKEEAQKKFEGRLIIRYGLELGQPHHDPQLTNKIMSRRNFDFVLGSVHYTDDEREILSIPYQNHEQADQVIREYFASVLRMLEVDCFDSLAHICHPLRVMQNVFNRPTFLEYMDMILPILRRIIDKGISLEVSTKGLRYWLRALEPEQEILKAYRLLGGELITVGTDSHEPETVGSGIRDAYQYIEQAGFRYIVCYEKHRPIMHRI